jgi:diguanylate cyclase (GGDEF)-like protein
VGFVLHQPPRTRAADASWVHRLCARPLGLLRRADTPARQAAVLFGFSGLVILGSEAIRPALNGVQWVQVIGLCDVVLSVVIWRLPWGRWHPRWVLVTVPIAFVFTAAGNMIRFTPLEYGVWFIVIFVWIGLTQGRWASVVLAPVAAIAYLQPLLVMSPPHPDAVASALTVLPLSVLVGEVVAAKVAALTAARRESEHSAELLRAVTKACRIISNLDRVEALAAAADAIAEIGFEGSSFTFFTPDGTRYRVEEARGLPPGYGQTTHLLEGTLTGLVRQRGETVVVDEYSRWLKGHPELRAAGFRATIGTPVFVGGEMVGAMIAGCKKRVRFTAQDFEAFELLAEQSGRALENVRTFQAEVTARRALAVDNVRDVLTGIGNRRHAMNLLESLRTGDALALIDLDHFKSVNDTYGHAEGDAVLMHLGEFLTAALRDGDDVARYGGEEFLLVLRTAGVEAAAILDRLTYDWRILGRRTTFSTGYAVHERGADPAETLGNADSALYAAKAAGRDRVQAFIPRPRGPAPALRLLPDEPMN